MIGVDRRPPDRQHTLPDGRSMDYSEYGAADGYPVFWFHGLLSSKVEVLAAADVIASEGLRVIAPNRPGYGLSTRARQGFTAVDWVHDIAELADALGIGQFALIAYSGASIYALAAKAALSDRISRVRIVSGTAPSSMPRRHRGSSPATIVIDGLAARLPWMARLLIGKSIESARRSPTRFVEQRMRDLRSAADRAILGGPEGAFVFEAFLEAGRQGPDGIVDDLIIVTRSACPPLDTGTSDVHLWHGEDDHAVPIAQGRWLAEQIPSATLTVWPEVGHLHTPAQWAEVCRTVRK